MAATALLTYRPPCSLALGVPFNCHVGAQRSSLFKSLSVSLKRSLQAKGIGFGVYGISLTGERTRWIMQLQSYLGLGGSRGRLRYWNDWVNAADFAAMLQDPSVQAEWAARRVSASPNLQKGEQHQRSQLLQQQQEQGGRQVGAHESSRQVTTRVECQTSGVSVNRRTAGPQFLGIFADCARPPLPQQCVASAAATSSGGGSHVVCHPLEENVSSTSRGGGPSAELPQSSCAAGCLDPMEPWVVPFSVSPTSGIPVVTHTELAAMTRILVARHFQGKLLRAFKESELLRMVGAVATVESSLQPFAYRYEEKRGEASTGLMQVLQSTADWLARDLNYRAYAVDWASSMLYQPFVAMYFGLAYLEWLSDYKGRRRGEEFVVRGYNGGPGGAESSSTDYYWGKYKGAKQALPPLPCLKVGLGSPPRPERLVARGVHARNSTASTATTRPLGRSPPRQQHSPDGGRILFDLSSLSKF